MSDFQLLKASQDVTSFEIEVIAHCFGQPVNLLILDLQLVVLLHKFLALLLELSHLLVMQFLFQSENLSLRLNILDKRGGKEKLLRNPQHSVLLQHGNHAIVE